MAHILRKQALGIYLCVLTSGLFGAESPGLISTSQCDHYQISRVAKPGVEEHFSLYLDEKNLSFLFTIEIREIQDEMRLNERLSPSIVNDFSLHYGLAAINGSAFYRYNAKSKKWDEVLINLDLFKSTIDPILGKFRVSNNPYLNEKLILEQFEKFSKQGIDDYAAYYAAQLDYIRRQELTSKSGEMAQIKNLSFKNFSREQTFELKISNGNVMNYSIVDGLGIIELGRFSRSEEMPKLNQSDIGNRFSDELLEKQYNSSRSGRLGISYSITSTGVVLVNSVVRGSVGEKAGIKAGDEIVAVNDILANKNEIEKLIEMLYEDDVLRLSLRRGGSNFKLTLNRPSFLEYVSETIFSK